MVAKLLNKTTKSVSAAALILGGSILVSRILGLLRDRILAGLYGAGVELDVYFSAFRIPDLIYSIIIGGAISSAFIPVFISHFTKSKKEAWEIARSFFYIAAVGLLVITSLVFIFMPLLMPLVVPGFDAESQEITVKMSRIMLLSPLFLGLSAVFSGILHSFKKFFVYSLAPIFYNIGIIIGALYFTPYFGIEGLAWGVALGAFLHMLIQAPVTFKSGFKLTPVKEFYHPAIKKIFKLMAPRTVGLAAYQVNLWVITAIASTLAAGSLTVFTLANNIHYLPIGIVGLSFATALFPNLSQSISEGKYKEYLGELSRTLRGVFFLVLPLSIMFFVLRAHIVRVVLGTGQFSWEDTRLTAAALGAFSIGIFSYALAPVLSRAFYAKENTVTPVIASTIGMLVNILLSILLIFVIFPRDGILILLARIFKIANLPDIAVIGLPVAFSLSGIVSLILLLWFFFREDERNKAIVSGIVRGFVRITIAGIAAGVVGWSSLQLFDYFFGPINTFIMILLQAAIATILAFAVYFLIGYTLHFEEFRVIISMVRQKLSKKLLPAEAPLERLDGFTAEEQ